MRIHRPARRADRERVALPHVDHVQLGERAARPHDAARPRAARCALAPTSARRAPSATRRRRARRPRRRRPARAEVARGRDGGRAVRHRRAGARDGVERGEQRVRRVGAQTLDRPDRECSSARKSTGCSRPITGSASRFVDRPDERDPAERPRDERRGDDRRDDAHDGARRELARASPPRRGHDASARARRRR